jgi:hypothetical protein
VATVRPLAPLWRLQRVLSLYGTAESISTTIGMLPDNVLLEIFDFYRQNLPYTFRATWRWHSLVHVCPRWRLVVFASPHRLDLQILCTHRTPVRRNLGIWPAFPIVINYRNSGAGGITPSDEDNVVAALERCDRVCYIRLAVTDSQLGKMALAMQGPFPELTHLHIGSDDGNAQVLPTKFMGASAPRLHSIYLHRIPLPTLPKLLMSTNDLGKLELRRIPPTGYIPPEAMVACLAALPRLDTFHIGFKSATSRPDRIPPPPETRTVLPTLTSFEFKGASEYLEDLVAQIDSPQLDRTFIVYFNQLIDFQAPQLSRFIDRSIGPKLASFGHVQVAFFSDWVTFDMYPHEDHTSSDSASATITISCEGIDWQVSHVAQVLSYFSATISNAIHLKLKVEPDGLQLKGMDDVEWQYLLRQCSIVQTLYVSQELAGGVAYELEHIAEDLVPEVLPSLDLICLAGQRAPSIGNFITARKLSGLPVSVVESTTEFTNRLESYASK